MENRYRSISALVCVVTLAALSACHSIPEIPAAERPDRYTSEAYAEVLEASVQSPSGLVDYAAIDGPVNDALERYLYAVGTFGPETNPEQFPSQADRQAYHLNAYNAFMLRKWLQKGARTAELSENVNWIVWFITDQWPMDDGKISMDALEQRLIRPTYDDPRNHFALVCGAMSCPPLLGEPFTGDMLDEQLDELGRRWLQQPDGLKITEDGDVYLSAIFDWYRSDFDGMGGLEGMLDRYLPDSDPRKSQAIEAVRNDTVKFLDYDWSINKAR
jgi:hypothetical protein